MERIKTQAANNYKIKRIKFYDDQGLQFKSGKQNECKMISSCQKRCEKYNIFQSGKITKLCKDDNKTSLKMAIRNSINLKSQCRKSENFFDRSSHRSKHITPTRKTMKNIKYQINIPSEKSLANEGKGQIPSEMEAEVKQIYHLISDLIKLGFTQRSIVQWMAKLLSKKNRGFRDIFMKISVNQKSLNNSPIYQRVTKVQASLQKLRWALKNANTTKILFFMNEIRQVKYYIEQILIKKSSTKIRQTQQFFNQSNNQCIMRTKIDLPSLQIAHFISDLKNIEQRNGRLSLVSKVNRKRFQQISRVQQTLNLIYRRNRAYENLFQGTK